MYSLFEKRMTASPAVMVAANWTNVRAGLQANLGKVVQFYRNAPMAVRADHFIVRLLQSITVSKLMPLERFYSNVDGLYSLNLGMALKMTSEISRGHVFDGDFYGPDSTEVLIAHTTEFDPFQADRYWQNLRPIRVLRHPRSDLGLNLPDGEKSGSEYGIAVLAINVPMLAVQWRAFWTREQFEAQLKGTSPRGVTHFVHQYVLPNMLYSHLDYVLFNRIDNLLQGRPMGEATEKHSFALPHWERQLNAVQTTMLDQLARNTKDFTTTLYNIPALSQANLLEVMKVPRLVPTRQVEWALSLSRLPALDFLTEISVEGGGFKNGQELNQLRQEMRAFKTGHVFQQMLPLDVYSDVKIELDRIAERIQ